MSTIMNSGNCKDWIKTKIVCTSDDPTLLLPFRTVEPGRDSSSREISGL